MGVSRIKEAFVSRVAATHDIQATRRAYEVYALSLRSQFPSAAVSICLSLYLASLRQRTALHMTDLEMAQQGL
jgi:hypothetical protein